MRTLAILLLLASAINVQAQTSLGYESQKIVTGSHAAVVSAHPLASKAGIEMLKQGGNAFDAAIATQLVLAVVYPGAGNIGGGGFLVGHLSNGKDISVDFREKAPSKAHRDMYLDSLGVPVTGLSLEGRLSSGVPGTVAGLFATLKYAKLPFHVLIAPAIRFAETGFLLTRSQAENLNVNREKFIRNNSSSIAFVKDVPWQEGDRLIQPELAATLKRISKEGKNGFYGGETATMLLEEMKKGNGVISYEDLKSYQAVERSPMRFSYKGDTVVTMPLPSSGGILLLQMMKMIEKRNIGAMGFLSPTAVQLMIEVERRAYADRAEYLGDIDFVKVPVKTITGKSYLENRMKDFIPGKASTSARVKPGFIKESEQTTHISIIDDEGNAVSVTTTLNDNFGSKTVVTGAGFVLNNEMDDFSVKPGVPNMYGAVGNEKNAIAPGKRMLSSMTPTIVLRNGKPVIIVGSPGGTTIITSVFQSLVDLLEFHMSPDDAVNQPKFHHQWLPDEVYVEQTFPRETISALEAMGYKINVREPIGRTELIYTRNRSKTITAIADHRGDDSAEAY